MGAEGVPLIVKAFREETDRTTRLEALAALRAMEKLTEEGMTVLPEALTDRDSSIRIAAVRVLVYRSERAAEAAPLLLSALGRETDADAKRLLADGVANLAGYLARRSKVSIEAVTPLIRLLEHEENPLLRESFALALGRLGPDAKPAVATLARCLQDPDSSVRFRGAEALARIGPAAADAVPALLAAFRAYRPDDRCTVVKALAEIAPNAEGVASVLVEALSNRNYMTRGHAVAGLRQLQDVRVAVPALERAVRDRHWDVREEALRALAKFGREAASATPTIVEALRDERASVRSRAVRSLGATCPDAGLLVRCLVSTLKDAAPEVRYSSAFILGERGREAARALPALTEALEDSYSGIRKCSAEALGKMGPAAAPAVPALKRALDDKVEDVRIAAARALRLIQHAAEGDSQE